MADKILVTGGAGFIGSHLVDVLVKKGYSVRVFDNLTPQVHGIEQKEPQYLNPEAEFVRGDMRNPEQLGKAITGVNAIFHLAAAVGVGQSMYNIREYMEVNTLGAANLLNILVEEKHKIERLIVASSMSVYGEGAYLCEQCGEVYPKLRSTQQLEQRGWEMKCPSCKRDIFSIPTPEDKPLYPTSIYAISKRDHEEMCLCIGKAYGMPTIALRFFNVYGPRQSLSNPYTGVAAIFSSRILNGNPPLVFEDGLQSRDFIHVSDIVQANILALENHNVDGEVFNVGTGRSLNLLDMLGALENELGKDFEPEIVNRFREGDIRHCYADISKIKEKLNFEPRISFEKGVADLVNWVKEQSAQDEVEKARQELELKGLIK